MQRVGYIFTVEGEYSTRSKPDDDDWIPFSTKDLHPAGESTIVVWPANCSEPSEQAEEEAVRIAKTVVDWMRTRLGWHTFYAGLFLSTGSQSQRKVFSWELT